MPEFSAEGFLLDDGWKLVEVEPEVVEVHATNGTNGNCHHDEAAEPQQTLFYRPLWTAQSPQPHLEDSSVYRPLRPTKLDKIKNLHAEIHTGAVDIPSWRGDVAFPN